MHQAEERTLSNNLSTNAVPFLIAVVGIIVSITISHALSVRNKIALTQKLEDIINLVSRDLRRTTEQQVFDIRQMSRRWNRNGRIPDDEWKTETAYFEASHTGVYATLWIDSDYKVNRVPLSLVDRIQPGTLLADDEPAKGILDRYTDSELGAVVRIRQLDPGGNGFQILVPVRKDEKFDGFIVGLVDAATYFDPIFQELAPEAEVTVSDQISRFHTWTPWEVDLSEAYLEEGRISLLDTTWHITVKHQRGMVDEIPSSLPSTIMVGGSVMALLLAFIISSWQRSTVRRTREVESANTELRQEISDRHRAELALSISEDRYRRLVDSSPTAVYVHCDGVFVFINPAGAILFGAETTDELIGMPIMDFVHPDSRAIVQAGIDTILHDKVPGRPIEERLLRLDGSAIDVESVSIPTIHDRLDAVQVVAFDITERKRAEAALRFTQFSIDHAGLSIFWIGVDGKIIYSNEAACRTLGYTSDEVPALNIIDVDINFTDPGEWDAAWETVKNERLVNRESVFKCKDGSRIPVETSSCFLRYDNEEYCFVFAQNITDRKILEEQLRQAQKLEAVGRLTGGIAHDFNNLLTTVIGSSHLLKRSLAENHPAQELILEIEAAGKRAANLTRQLLAFSRKATSEDETFPVSPLILEIRNLLVRLMGENMQLDLDLADNAACIRAEPGHIEQVLMNLTANARDAIGEYGIITIRSFNQDLSETDAAALSVPAGPYVVIQVSDNGEGIDTETRERIFDPFFTTKKVGRGTGLGLAMAYGIVTQAGGAINVTSEPGEGATFTLYFPRQDIVPAEVAPGSTTAVDIPRGSEAILVAEDEPSVSNMVQRILESSGYHVTTCANGEEALDTFSSNGTRFDLLLTDIIMPGLNGRQLAVKLKELRPDLKVLYMTGYIESLQKKQMRSEIDDGYLIEKPFTPRALLVKVRDILDE